MRIRLSGAAVAALAFIGGQAAWAQGAPSVRTTAQLAELCRMEDRSFCYGFLNGAGQFYEMLVDDPDLDVDPFVCPGRQVSEDEAVDIFLDWLDENPDAGQTPPVDGLFQAWVAAFPCE